MNIIKSTDFSHRWNIVLFLWELVCPFKEVIEQLSHPRLNLIYLLNRAPIAIFENRKQHRSCSLCWLVSIGHHILKLDFSALSRPCNHVVIPPPRPPAWPLKQKSTQMGLDKKSYLTQSWYALSVRWLGVDLNQTSDAAKCLCCFLIEIRQQAERSWGLLFLQYK